MIVITPDSDDDDICECGRRGGLVRGVASCLLLLPHLLLVRFVQTIYHVLKQEIPGFSFGQGTQCARGNFVGAKQVEVQEQGMNICSQHAPRISSSSSSLPKMALNTSSLGRSASSASFLPGSTAAPGSA
jgi:hypothetical protein